MRGPANVASSTEGGSLNKDEWLRGPNATSYE